MNISRSAVLLFCSSLVGCLSQSAPPDEHYFTAPLPPLASHIQPGTQPLRLEFSQSSAVTSESMLWRLSATEVAPDPENSWAVHPAHTLEERLRDLLFSQNGFRVSITSSAHLLSVRFVILEGALSHGGLARVEVVATFRPGQGSDLRRRFHEEEPLKSLQPSALAAATGRALDRLARSLSEWTVEQAGAGE